MRRKSLSLGPKFAIQTSYRDFGTPRPRNRATRMRSPSCRGSIFEAIDFVFTNVTYSNCFQLALRARYPLTRLRTGALVGNMDL
jgi:hypothetical protein